jgi:hypothetical protein
VTRRARHAGRARTVDVEVDPEVLAVAVTGAPLHPFTDKIPPRALKESTQRWSCKGYGFG